MRCSVIKGLAAMITLLVCMAGCGKGESGEAARGTAIEFRLVDPAPDSQAPALTVKDTTAQFRVAPKVLMTGEAIASVDRRKEPAGDRFSVRLGLTRDGATRFGDLTAAHAKELLAIVADGQIVAAVQIPDSPILDGTLIINGQYSEQEARDIVSQLRGHLGISN